MQTEPGLIDRTTALRWVESWDVQQERYAHRREERCAVVADLVRAALTDAAPKSTAAPVVVDLGAGPGTLAQRIAAALPQARVVALEADPFLVALGRAWCGDQVEFVEATVGSAGWTSALGPVNAFVSSTALHYPGRSELLAIYTDAREGLTAGGLLVNADHFPLSGGLGRLLPTHSDGGTEWAAWWTETGKDPALAGALATRDPAALPHGDNDLTTDDHLALLRAAGFASADTVWRDGVSAVVAARR